MATQVRRGMGCCRTSRASSAVNSGASDIVTSTLATVVSDSATMKAVNMMAQHRPEAHTAAPRIALNSALPRITPRMSSSASAVKLLRQKVISKPRAASRCRVTTPAELHSSVTSSISNTADRCVINEVRP